MGPIQKNKCKLVKKKWIDDDIEKTLSNVAVGISNHMPAKTHNMVEGTLQRIGLRRKERLFLGLGINKPCCQT